MNDSEIKSKIKEELSNWFNSAKLEPVFINCGTERFALMNEEYYLDLIQKLGDLQSSLVAVLADSDEQ